MVDLFTELSAVQSPVSLLKRDPKPKSREGVSSPSSLVSQDMHAKEVQELRNMIEEQRRTSEMQTRQMEEMIEEMTRV